MGTAINPTPNIYTGKVNIPIFELQFTSNPIFNHLKNKCYLTLSHAHIGQHLYLYEYFPEEHQDISHLLFRGETSSIHEIKKMPNKVLRIQTSNSIYELKYIDTIELSK